ncbi:lipase 1 [Talaromyces proteolyticus]|uniref:Lipase 1 n=1 Tax=Talaromyces proteolyticus TaxID=1131652 RepID=A0AAD4L0X8_9EURO|nr:lipase 1 [Talaromyces proteolyticus]KAH8700874.1 lipase 1 [Talaromyces proteolyticus]
MNMYTSIFTSLTLSLLAAVSSALQTGHDPIISHLNTSLPAAIPPSLDPFYTAPVGFEYTTPGTILRIRRAPGNFTAVMGSNCSAAYNIVYRTTNSRYLPSWSVTTLLIPSTPLTNSTVSGLGSALLSYLIPYNSVDVDSSPSYILYSSSTPPYGDQLGSGWFVNVPDFEGPTASNVAGIEEAHAVLDSIRAVLSSDLGLAIDAQNALWGYSGGSIAAEWALEFQEQYAPELKITGAALGGLVCNTTYVFDTVGNTMWASHGIAGLLGVTSQYPDAYNYILDHLKPSGPYNKTTFLSIRNMSYDQGHAAFNGQNMYDYFINGRDVMQAEPVKRALQLNTIMTYHGVPQTPLFIYKAIHDEITPINQTDAYVERVCGLGVNVLYQRNTRGGHVDELTNGAARAMTWLTTVLEGRYASIYSTTGCIVQNVTVGESNTGL